MLPMHLLTLPCILGLPASHLSSRSMLPYRNWMLIDLSELSCDEIMLIGNIG